MPARRDTKGELIDTGTDRRYDAPVLVVEDDSDCRVMLATLLTFAGYKVVTASNGAEGLTVARRHTPCLILLDYMMPIMDGLEFRTQQRADSCLHNIPVVLVSARHDAKEVASLLEVAAVVEKPIVHEALLQTVHKYCPPTRRPSSFDSSALGEQPIKDD